MLKIATAIKNSLDARQKVREALEPDTRAVVAKSEPIRADSLDVPVAWQEGNLRDAAGATVLRFTPRNARLYALWCTDGPQG